MFESLVQINEPSKLYNKNKYLSRLKNQSEKIYVFLLIMATSFYLSIDKVFAVDKLEGGDITIKGLGDIIKGLATKIQIFGIAAAFIALVVFIIQFIVGDDETKQRKKKTILYTLGGVALLILVPSIINIIIDTLD